MAWLVALVTSLQLQVSRQMVTWGNSSCWSDWRIHELCCFPVSDIWKASKKANSSDGRDRDRRHSWYSYVRSCWSDLSEDLEVSQCCRPRGSFFEVASSAPLVVHRLFEGCQDPFWQSFLFKVRITGGNVWAVQPMGDFRTEAWFEYFDFGLPESIRFKKTKMQFAGCPIGMALANLLRHYIAMTTFLPLPLNVLQFLDAAEVTLEPFGGLFHFTGISWHQLRYIRSLYVLQTRHFSGDFNLPLVAPPTFPVPNVTNKVVFDFGASRGIDAEMMLRQGFKVVAVEGNPLALSHFKHRLEKQKNSRLRGAVANLKIIHAATGGTSVPALALFEVDHHHEEKSNIFDPTHDTPLVDAQMMEVPRQSCGYLYRQFVPPHQAALYAKIDLEGADLDCLGSLLRNATTHAATTLRQPAPQLPLFISLEVLNDKFSLKPAKLHEMPMPTSTLRKSDKLLQQCQDLIHDLLGAIGGHYCQAKLCRQHIYNIRTIPGHQSIPELVSRLGFGSSGPFGDNAVDWRRGQHWAPVDEVLLDLFPAAMLSRGAREWFDLHLRRC